MSKYRPWLVCILYALIICSAECQNGLFRRGFRAPAQRHHPKQIVTKRDASFVAITGNGGGGWTIPIVISGQEMTFNVDTSSSDLWVASTLMSPHQQSELTTGRIFNPNTSPTYEVINGSTFEVAYVDGSKASGPVGADAVSVGEAAIPRMQFGVCSEWVLGAGGVVDTRETTGPLGLAFPYGSQIDPKPECTFIKCVEPYIPAPVFSTAFTLTGGFIDFGFNDSTAYTGDLTTVPIANLSSDGDGSWVSQGVQFGSQGEVFNSEPSEMLFGTGSANLELPAMVASKYMGLIQGSSNSTGSWKYPCRYQLPDFDFIFTQTTSGPSKVTIPGKAISADIFNENLSASDDCSTWITVTDYRGNVGIPFFVSQYMIWNFGEPSLSFATATGKNSSTSEVIKAQNPATSTSATQKSTTTAQNNGVQQSRGSASLSPGDKAGIGVGVAIVALSLTGLAIWTFRRHRRTQVKTDSIKAEESEWAKPELEGEAAEKQRSELTPHGVAEVTGEDRAAQLSGTERHEMMGDGTAAELSANGRHELPTDWHGHEAGDVSRSSTTRDQA